MAANIMQLSKLSDDARKVLDLIVRHNITDGSSLISRMGVSRPRDQITKSIRELEALDLIEVGGPITDEELPFARFGVRPSAKDYLQRMLRQLE